MVDRADIDEANRLIAESNNITEAITAIDAGGQIVDFSISVPPPGSPGGIPSIQVISTYMQAPPIMYQTIRALLVQRQADINAQLAALGVT